MPDGDNCIVSVRLNGSRLVTGVLRGFDPFMNLVIDEAVEECKTGEKNHIGMVVCDVFSLFKDCSAVTWHS